MPIQEKFTPPVLLFNGFANSDDIPYNNYHLSRTGRQNDVVWTLKWRQPYRFSILSMDKNRGVPDVQQTTVEESEI